MEKDEAEDAVRQMCEGFGVAETLRMIAAEVAQWDAGDPEKWRVIQSTVEAAARVVESVED
jgi:hypothetical protein